MHIPACYDMVDCAHITQANAIMTGYFKSVKQSHVAVFPNMD